MDAPRTAPYHWWGDAWARPNPWSLGELVSADVITDSQARELIEHVGAGGNVVVVSPGSGTGKSTVAWALIGYCPSDRAKYFVRGNQESFDWANVIQPGDITLLVNEIGPHLTVYLWDAGLRALFDIVAVGAQLIATAHAGSAAELRESLIKNGVPSEHVVALGLVVALDETRPTPSRLCPVRSIEHL